MGGALDTPHTLSPAATVHDPAWAPSAPPLPAEPMSGASGAASLFPRDVLDALPFAVVEIDALLTVTNANQEAARLLGLSATGSSVGLPEPWLEFSLRRFARRLCATPALPAEVRAHVDGGRILDLTGIPLQGGALVVFRDVTARVHEEEADRAFVANAAHELRASLGGISSAVEALERGAKDDGVDGARLLHGVVNEVRRLRREVDTLLALARAHAEPRALALEPVALAPVVEQVADSLAVRPGVDVQTACDRRAAVRAQRPLLEIALRNLARNAARHTRRGRITLSCSRLDTHRVAVEVADDGPGISEHVRARLFERFASGDADEGFGLGLPLTREIVRLLDGNIDVDSDGGGTTVRLLLPAA